MTGRLAKLFDSGMGANMAIRKEVLVAVGGFDEILGAGGKFPSFEDGDFAYRALKAGAAILHLPNARVVHHGFRTWEAGRVIARETFTAIGAGYMKHVRCWDGIGLLLLTQQIEKGAFEIFRNIVGLRRPIGLNRFISLFVGCYRSFGCQVDRRLAIYAQPSNSLVSALHPRPKEST